MNFWIMRAIVRDHFNAERRGVYENLGCLPFILKVVAIVLIIAVLNHFGLWE